MAVTLFSSVALLLCCQLVTSSVTVGCLKNEYLCPTGACIDKLMVCDGYVDCPGYYDELNCTKSNISRSLNDSCSGFVCKNSACLPRHKVCDGNGDCPYDEDELNCVPDDMVCLKDCGYNEAENVTFELCISNASICDGVADCYDGLDETNCSKIKSSNESKSFSTSRNYNRRRLSQDNSTFIDCGEPNAFDCGDGKCIDKNLTCNRKFDCLGGQDEHDFCDKTPCEAKLCSHYCVFNKSNNGSKCICSDGYQLLPDGLTCEDIDECTLDPFKRPCTHECTNTLGSYRCSCFEGFTSAIEYGFCVPITKKNRCAISAKESYLLTLKDGHIFLRYFKCITDQSPIIVANVTSKVSTFTYDRSSRNIYTYDVAQKSINLIHFNNDTIQFLQLENSTRDLNSLTYDDLTGNLYWIEPFPGLLKIISTKDPNKTIITLSGGLQDANSLALYQERGEMYISMIGSEPKIVVYDLKGEDIRQVDESGSSIHPSSLFVDKFSKRLFWSDFGYQEVYYVSLDGRRGDFGPKEVVHRSTHKIRSMVVYDYKMYLATDNLFIQVDLYDVLSQKEIKKLDSLKERSLIHNDFYVHCSVDFNYRNPCLNDGRGNCSHVCTFIDSTVHCLCPHRMVLDQTKRKCETKNISCSSGEILCKDGLNCYKESKKCDGHKDCDDGSDELDCVTSDCPEGHAKCLDTSKCIPKKWFCDSYLDCSDGSDEKDCAQTCNHGDFNCNASQCIPGSWVCDGIPDCDNGSDEKNCLY
ncbi:low-density lipoprotein receptor-related protein 2-like [Tetranychus urticae]|uniref:EGF-like domain-containing protein n=1 Tax=Tetranychus urticae TaxID=32264 RepID=T1KTW9_TETUR|nr:low-density lipoprotein receptor-related protein 2-like [Tetranychus urticae]